MLKMELRPRTVTNYRQLHEGQAIDLNSSVSNRVTVGIYPVQRVIWKRKSPQGLLYLVEWADYPLEEATWEPADHIPAHLLKDYSCPPVSSERLRFASAAVERSLKTAVKSPGGLHSAHMQLDVYRYAFGHLPGYDKEIFLHKNDFSRLTLSQHWWYTLNYHGEGQEINFPVRVSPRLTMKKIWITTEGVLTLRTVPEEKIVMFVTSKVCTLRTLNSQ